MSLSFPYFISVAHQWIKLIILSPFTSFDWSFRSRFYFLYTREKRMVSSSAAARFAALAALLAIVGISSLAPTTVEAANATVLLYRHSTLDKVPSRAARNVAVSL